MNEEAKSEVGDQVEEEVAEATTAAEEAAAEAEEAAEIGTSEILDQVTILGNKVSEAIHKVWDSEERKKAEAEINDALRIAGTRIDQVAEEFRTGEFARDLKLQADKMVDAVEESKLTQEVRRGLLLSLRRLNEELSSWLEREDARIAAATEAEQAGAAGEAEPPTTPE